MACRGIDVNRNLEIHGNWPKRLFCKSDDTYITLSCQFFHAQVEQYLHLSPENRLKVELLFYEREDTYTTSSHHFFHTHKISSTFICRKSGESDVGLLISSGLFFHSQVKQHIRLSYFFIIVIASNLTYLVISSSCSRSR